MIPAATHYTSYTQARDNLVKVLEQVEQGDSIVVVQRRGHADVAMIAADELSILLEHVYLLKSPANAKRLFAGLEWSDQQLNHTPRSLSLAELRTELEAELAKEEDIQA
ncbi:MAG: type II toxin-antitoxin system Phd/YefM family antitoxin [Thermosynechococcaceae cyanobacterium]